MAAARLWSRRPLPEPWGNRAQFPVAHTWLFAQAAPWGIIQPRRQRRCSAGFTNLYRTSRTLPGAWWMRVETKRPSPARP
jgi:hypothetical protein